MYLMAPWRKKTLKLDIFFPSADRTSHEDKDCPSDLICCSEMHPIPKVGFLSAAPHSRVRPETTGDPSLASSVFTEMPWLAWGCGTASFKESCRWSLGCLGSIVLGSLMCGRSSNLLTALRIWNVRCRKFITRLFLATAFCMVKRWSRWLDLWRNRMVMHSLP